mgnify:CR=1 FL=1
MDRSNVRLDVNGRPVPEALTVINNTFPEFLVSMKTTPYKPS